MSSYSVLSPLLRTAMKDMISSKRTCQKCCKNVVEACCHKLLTDPTPAPPTEQGEDTDFTKACGQGNAKVVAESIKNGVDLEKRNKNGYTPLMSAVSGNHVDCVKLLITCRCNVNAIHERTKDTALSMAAAAGHEEIVNILVKADANIEHRNGGDYTPLTLAASGGHLKVIELLIECGAHVDAMIDSKMRITPLMMAAMNGKDEAVKLLLQHGADMHVQIEGNRNTALQLATAKGRTSVVKLLLESQNGSWKPGTSLAAKRTGYHKHLNLEHRSGNGFTALMEAAREGHVEIGRLLLYWGADPNTVTTTAARDTALSFAAEKGNVQFVQALLDAGAYVNVQVRKNCSPLWIACSSGHAPVVRIFIEHEADVDQPDGRGVTPLMVAFRKGHVEVVKDLVRHVSRLLTVPDLDRYLSRPELQEDKELRGRCLDCMSLIVEEQVRQESQALKAQQTLLKQLETEEQLAEQRRKSRLDKKQNKSSTKAEEKSEEGSTEDCDHTVVTEEYFTDCEEEGDCEDEAASTTESSDPIAIASQYSDFECYIPSSFESHHGEWVNTSELKKKKPTVTSPVVKPAPIEVPQHVPDSGAKVLKLTSSQIGRVIGRAGANINKIRDATSASIDVQKVSNRMDGLRTVTVKGGPRAVSKAAKIIELMLKEHEVDVDTVIGRIDHTQRSFSADQSVKVATPKKKVIMPAPNPPPILPVREDCSDSDTWIVEDQNNNRSSNPEPKMDDREQLSLLLSSILPAKNGYSIMSPIAPPSATASDQSPRNPFDNVSSPSPSVSYREEVERFLGFPKPAPAPINPFSGAPLDEYNPFASTGDSRFQSQGFAPENPFPQPRRSPVDSLGMTSMHGHGLFPGANSSPFAAVHSRSPFDDVPRTRNPFDNIPSPSPSVNCREEVERFLGFPKPAPAPTNPFSGAPLDGFNPFASTGDSRFQGPGFAPENPFQHQQPRRSPVDSLGMTSMYGHGLFPGANSTSSPFAAVHSRSPFDDVPRARNPFENVSSPSPSVSYREDVGRFLGYHKPAHVPTNPFSTLDGCNPFASAGDSRFQGRSFVPEDAYQQQQARRLAVDSLGMTSMPSRNPWD